MHLESLWMENQYSNRLFGIQNLLVMLFLDKTLLTFIAKYGVPTNQLTWLYEALLEVSQTKIALWIRVSADDWTTKSAIKASND